VGVDTVKTRGRGGGVSILGVGASAPVRHGASAMRCRSRPTREPSTAWQIVSASCQVRS